MSTLPRIPRFLPLTALGLALMLTGCLSKPALVRQDYAFVAHPAANVPAGRGEGVVAVRLCEVSPVFAGRALVYRVGPEQYETDPYAGFMAPPDRTLSIAVRDYLRGSGAFRDVAEPGSALEANRFLEIHVTELYGDIQDPGKPAAVLTLRLLLFGEGRENAGKPLFQKEYSRRLPVNRNTASDIVAGWNLALGEIMTEAGADLAAGGGETASADAR